jgi:ABC-type nitrate/sulfonate/bicarbonate transport system substrate-binding protein
LLAHGLELERGDYTLLPKGATGHRLESMNQGESFAGILNPPWDAKANAAGMKRFADQREILPEYPGGVFAVNRQWANDNRAILIKYLTAWDQGLHWAQDLKNHREAIELITQAEKMDEASAANRLRQLPSNGQLNLAGLQTVLDLRVQFGLTPSMGKDLLKYYDDSFYNQAAK